MYGDYRPSYHTIEPYDGMIYVVSHDYASDTAEEILSLYPTGENAHAFWDRAGGFQRELRAERGRGETFYTPNGRVSVALSSAVAEHTLRVPVPCPAHRKSKHPVAYKNGYWYRDGRQGWERL